MSGTASSEVMIQNGRYVFSVSKTGLDTDRILLYLKQAWTVTRLLLGSSQTFAKVFPKFALRSRKAESRAKVAVLDGEYTGRAHEYVY